MFLFESVSGFNEIDEDTNIVFVRISERIAHKFPHRDQCSYATSNPEYRVLVVGHVFY